MNLIYTLIILFLFLNFNKYKSNNLYEKPSNNKISYRIPRNYISKTPF